MKIPKLIFGLFANPTHKENFLLFEISRLPASCIHLIFNILFHLIYFEINNNWNKR